MRRAGAVDSCSDLNYSRDWPVMGSPDRQARMLSSAGGAINKVQQAVETALQLTITAYGLMLRRI